METVTTLPKFKNTVALGSNIIADLNKSGY